MRSGKKKTHFICQLCGYQSSKWMGKCPNCNEWNTLVEENILSNATPRQTLTGIGGEGEAPQSVSEIETNETFRIKTGIGEFDRVLGGGIVLGSVILIGGDPGIGKSTLLLQALNQIMQSYLLDSIKQYMDDLPTLKGSAIILDDNSERIYPMRMRPRFTWHGGEAPTAIKAEKEL